MTLIKFFLIFFVFFNLEISFSNEIWRNRVYLATYPRSGNHWMRYMIEELTGKATGSVYPDADEPVHLSTIFSWGGYAPKGGYEGNREYPKYGDLILLKTHFPVMGDFEGHHEGAVRIVRNPIDSFYSYAVYLGYVKNEEFPNHLLLKFLKEFKNFQNFWDNQDNVLTIKYEDLLLKQPETLTKVADFLKIDYSENDIKRVITRYAPFGEYLKHKNKFSEEMIKKIKFYLADFLDKYDYDL